MAPVKPMLDDVELQQVQKIEVDGDQVLIQHGVPALDGDFLQGLGRRATQVTLSGVLTGPEAGAGLKTLRDKFRAAEPVPFVADIATATQVGQVLIEEMGVRELAGKPERFEYAFTLREYSPPPEVTETPPEIETPENPDEDIDQGVGTLIVEVIVEGQSGFDFSRVTVTVQGTQADGSSLSRTLTDRTDNVWTAENVPASQGEYIVQAMETNPQPLSGSTTVAVQAGQRAQATITLHPSSIIAKAFVIHFDHDKAFIRPCMRAVLQQVADYSNQHRNEKLLIVGHTDKTGINPSEPYNQSLSERRARSAYAYLTFGITPDASVAEWNLLREQRTPRQLPTVHDTWAEHEYQYMLQDLGFYPYKVDGRIGNHTNAAIEAFRCEHGLPPGQAIDPQTWEELIRAYLRKANLGIPPERFLPNCSDEVLKWLGSGEEDPVRNTPRAWRPNRRTEFLFVRANALPCDMPKPDTFDIPQPPARNVVGSNWCLDSGGATTHHCYVTPASSLSCPQNVQNQWCRPASPPTITVTGSIKREVRLAGGATRLDPVPNQKFVLIAPNGVVKASETASGESNPARTDRNGEFSFADLPSGIYTLEVHQNRGSVLIRRDPPGSDPVTGNTICAHLEPGQDQLGVVILSDPVLREIRLPVVAHLMTPLEGTSATARTCPDPTNPGNTRSQATARTDDEIRELFDKANEIWRQARIRFEPVEVVRSAYIHPLTDPAIRGSCEIDDSEFKLLMRRCDYPEAIDVFFFGDLRGSGTAGKGVSPESAAVDGLPGGCAVADRFSTTVSGVPGGTLSRQQSIQTLAHVLGLYLNLEQVPDTPANADRLMRPMTAAGTNATLIDDEVARARSSQGAANDCMPLSLKVTGATRVGGTLSHQYIFVQHPELVDPFDIVIDADIPDHLLANGTLTMTDGTNTITGRQMTVSKANIGETTIVATYTPTGGGQPVSRRVIIRVAAFTLRVEGDVHAGSTTPTTFFTLYEPTEVVTILAELDPAPFCVPNSLARWNRGTETPDPLRQTVSRSDVRSTPVTATVAGETRSVTISVIGMEVTETAGVGASAVTFVRFGLWDDAYDAAGNVKFSVAAEANNFIGSDRRKFHFRVRDPSRNTNVQVNWKTLNANGTDDDAPASQVLTLPETAAGSGMFISRAVMLVTDDTDRNQEAHSGLPAGSTPREPRRQGESNHRLRRAKIDGSVRLEYSPAAGVNLSHTLPVFNRAVPFTTSSTDNVAPGTRVVTPTAMSGTTPTGARWSIRVGAILTIDTGVNREDVTVTAVTPITFTATFTKAHSGATAPYQIVGHTDERRRLTVRVIRYNNPADPTYLSATNANIRDQFEHANLRWWQTGLQLDRLATQDRNVPAGALNAARRFPFSHPDGPQEQAVLADLLPVTPDNTLTVVFLHLDPLGHFNAYAAILPTSPVPLPAGGTVTMDDRFFIFINSRLDPNLETLAHELHHVLFNRGDAATPVRFFTFNTNAPLPPLPDVRKYRRIQTLHTADVNLDPNNDNTFNWQRRQRTGDRTVGHDFNPPATPSTGNRFTGGF